MTFQKGNTLGRANKGRKPAKQTIEASVSARKGKPLTQEHRDSIRKALKDRIISWGEKISKASAGKAKPNLTGIKNGNWKGDNVGYGAMHCWVKRWKGKATHCESCGETAKKYEWANIDHQYRRVLDDYLSMCTKCHRQYDVENNNYKNNK